LRITNLHGSDAKCYEDAALEVAEAPSGSIFVVVVVVGAVVATAAAALALRRRRGREAVGSV
jgi:MYXO-CTERM domain-containing protein